mmetsp:Transcript_25574/g.67584  ORF Transcript_25574/g.67584 Transcript_25574/m.67584 type:complete len:242 (+) Transcript_25574:125-850(+)
MQSLFNCCHGVCDTKPGKWICTQQLSAAGRTDEEVIGNHRRMYKPHVQKAGEGVNMLPARGGPPKPAGLPGSAEDDSAKQRLQRLIRNFAHDTVGPGLRIKVLAHEDRAAVDRAPGLAGETAQAMLLRMDRRLSRIELWLPDAGRGGTASMAASLQEVESISKGSMDPVSRQVTASSPEAPQSHAGSPRDIPALIFVKKSGDNLRLIFDCPIERDRAYTCFRIFQMSVDQSGQGLEDDGAM